MHVSHQRILCIKIFKILNKLSLSFKQDIFKVKSFNYLLRNRNNLKHYKQNQVTYGSNSLLLGPQILNGPPNEMKTAENLNICKNMLKNVGGT